MTRSASDDVPSGVFQFLNFVDVNGNPFGNEGEIVSIHKAPKYNHGGGNVGDCHRGNGPINLLDLAERQGLRKVFNLLERLTAIF